MVLVMVGMVLAQDMEVATDKADTASNLPTSNSSRLRRVV